MRTEQVSLPLPPDAPMGSFIYPSGDYYDGTFGGPHLAEIGREEKLLEKLERMIHTGNSSTAKYVAEELRRFYNSEIKDIDKSTKAAEKRADIVRRMGKVHWILNEQALAMKYYSDAIFFAPKSKTAVMAYNGIGEMHRLNGRWAEANDVYNKAKQIADELGYKDGAAEALRGLGYVHWRLGEIEDARSAYALALNILGKGDTSITTGRLKIEIANLHNEMNELDEAEEVYKDALENALENGDRWEQARIQNNLAFLYGKLGEWGKARKEAERVVKTGEMLNEKRWVGWGLMNLSEAMSRNGDGVKGKEYITRAMEALKSIEDPVGLAKCMFIEGYAYEAMGQNEKAFACFVAGLHAVQQQGMATIGAYFTLEYALALERLGEKIKALRQAEKARDLYKKLNIPRYVRDCEAVITRLSK